jgi:flagellar hook-associated protein 3 FlgL
MMAEIGNDVYLAMNIPGIEVFNTRPSDSGDRRKLEQTEGRAPAGEGGGQPQGETQNVNLFQELQVLRIGLLTGDLDAIRGTLERFDALQTKLLGTRSKIGSRINGLQSSTQALERHTLTNAGLSSALEDADMAQVVSDLAKEETVFRSSLQSSQKLLQPTLLEFLK